MGRDRRRPDRTPRPPSTDACIDLTTQRMEVASEALASTTDTPAVADLEGRGAPRTVTIAEGRLSALLEARRRSSECGSDDATRAICGVLEEWEAALAEAERLGPSWQAYRSGGVDELRSLLVDLRGDDGP
jgi:hypothetical protein